MKKEALRDVEGLEPLETSIKLLWKMIEFLDLSFLSHDLSEITQILSKSSIHSNKFVRETTFNIIWVLIKIAGKSSDEMKSKFIEQCHDLIPKIANGLADSWSNVRNAASSAANVYCLFADDKQELRDKYDEIMLPPICLSRYYIPEGVENIFIEIWKIVAKDQGINILLSHCDKFWKYYIESWYAENQVIRKASWHWIAEIWTKVANLDPEPFRPYVSDMIVALLKLLNDPNWPVRDSAWLSLGRLAEIYPEELSTK